jgi:hypothetical protein
MRVVVVDTHLVAKQHLMTNVLVQIYMVWIVFQVFVAICVSQEYTATSGPRATQYVTSIVVQKELVDSAVVLKAQGGKTCFSPQGTVALKGDYSDILR